MTPVSQKMVSFQMQLIGFLVVLLCVQSVTSDAMAKRNSKWPMALHKRGPNMIPNVPDSITDEVQSVTNDALEKDKVKRFDYDFYRWHGHKRGPPQDN
eukprot:XP_019919041.1 PREDICTED: uncharacterized protein LOC109617426 isoform X2 [Crassostrea gigas]